jgi:hypothetical protein
MVSCVRRLKHCRLGDQPPRIVAILPDAPLNMRQFSLNPLMRLFGEHVRERLEQPAIKMV